MSRTFQAPAPEPKVHVFYLKALRKHLRPSDEFELLGRRGLPSCKALHFSAAISQEKKSVS